MSPQNKPKSLRLSAARRLSVETLDPRVVLSGNSFLGPLFAGSEMVGFRGWQESPPATIAAEAGAMHEVALLHEAYSGLHRFERSGPDFVSYESHQDFARPIEFPVNDQFKAGASAAPATLAWDGPAVPIGGRMSFDVRPFVTNITYGSGSVLIVDRPSEGGYAEMRALWFDNGGIFLLTKGPMTDHPAARYYSEKYAESASSRDDVNFYASKQPSVLANMNAMGAGKEAPGTLPESNAYLPGIHNYGSQSPNAPTLANINARATFVPSATNPGLATATQVWGTNADSSATTGSLALSTGGFSGPASEGGAIDISPNLLPGNFSSPIQRGQRSGEIARADDEPAASDELDKFWADLGENLESLDPAQLVLDADDASGPAAETEAELPVMPIDHALAIHDAEGGTVELTVNRATPGPSMAGGELPVSARPTWQVGPQSVEIEMDTTVAMFQAFEIETTPRSKPQPEASDPGSDTEATDAAEQQPQPTDRASLSPLSILIAAATTTMRSREDNDERSKLAPTQRGHQTRG